MNMNLYVYAEREIILTFACAAVAFVGCIAVSLWKANRR